jgi:hypothetical protein
MQLLGDALQGGSELQLHQVGRRRAVESWEFSDGHGDFVAGVAPDTVDAILPYFVW